LTKLTLPVILKKKMKTDLYIDSEGVQRGYYVYLHKDRATGEVFYVGKGHGRRAWKNVGRNDAWKKKVASLSDGWSVEIARDNLSEIEAFELEEELVENFGGAAVFGGKLTNQAPGGEELLSVGFGFRIPGFSDYYTAYYEARMFKALPRMEQERIANAVEGRLRTFDDQFFRLEKEALEVNKKLYDSASYARSIILDLLKAASDFERRRISWKDFGIALEDAVDDLELELEDSPRHHPRVLALLEEIIQPVQEFLTEIDSGNREEAEESAKRETRH
jgi:hypothetical protein